MVDQSVYLLNSLRVFRKIQYVYLKNLKLIVNLYIDHIFSGYVCVP